MTRQRTLLAALIASTLALTAGAAMARPGDYGPHCDTNGDGKISREEAQTMPRLAQEFDRLDTNKDGFLSRDEFMQHHNQAGMMPHRGGPAGQPPVQDNGLPFSGL